MKRFFATAFLTFCAGSYAATQHEAHTHGLAELNVAYDAQQLIIELRSPAVNLIGFEHEPQNIEQQVEIENLIRSIQAPENYFVVPPSCALNSIDFSSPFTGADDFGRERSEEEGAHDDEHEHHQERHEQREEHGHHERHEEEHEGEHGSENHKDIVVSYEWDCADKNLSAISVNLFRVYPAIEKIDAQWIVSGKQGAKVLTKSSSNLQF